MPKVKGEFEVKRGVEPSCDLGGGYAFDYSLPG